MSYYISMGLRFKFVKLKITVKKITAKEIYAKKVKVQILKKRGKYEHKSYN